MILLLLETMHNKARGQLFEASGEAPATTLFPRKRASWVAASHRTEAVEMSQDQQLKASSV